MFFELLSRTSERVFALKYDPLSSGRPGFLLQGSLVRPRLRPPLLCSDGFFSPVYSVRALSWMGLLEAAFRTAPSTSGGRPGSGEAESSTLLGRRLNIDHAEAAADKNVDNNKLAVLVWIQIPVN